MKTKLHFVLSFSMFLVVFCSIAQQSYWQKQTNTRTSNFDKLANLNEKSYQTYQLDINGLKQNLISAPLRGTAVSSSSLLDLPNEDGTMETFRVVEAPVLSAELSQQFPNIKTYIGYGVKTTRSKS